MRVHASRLVAVAVVSLGGFGLGCGGGSPTQMSARDQTASAACDYAQRCTLIGTGLTYSSRDDCELKIKNYFETAWPPDQCTMVSSNGLDACLTTIRIATCGSGADFLNVVANKCTKAAVCGS